MGDTGAERGDGADRDRGYAVGIGGGGPAGCAAGVFTARYGLDTGVFDRGRSSSQRCAYLENYLGFPAGVDIETLYGLMHDHAGDVGCEIIPDLVESVERTDDVRRTASAEPAGATDSGDGDGFVVEPQEGDAVTVRRVVAATRYDGEYMRGLDDDASMFETYEYDGETHEHFDGEYADHDGATPVEGLYVASPSTEDRQALMAAGRGARVGLRVVEDARQERGYPEAVADHYDWMRRESELDDEWNDRDRWREWFDDQLPDDQTSTKTSAWSRASGTSTGRSRRISPTRRSSSVRCAGRSGCSNTSTTNSSSTRRAKSMPSNDRLK